MVRAGPAEVVKHPPRGPCLPLDELLFFAALFNRDHVPQLPILAIVRPVQPFNHVRRVEVLFAEPVALRNLLQFGSGPIFADGPEAVTQAFVLGVNELFEILNGFGGEINFFHDFDF